MRARRHLLHPRRTRLAVWLDADDDRSDVRVTSHLETCNRCAERLDELARSDPRHPAAVADPEVGRVIAELWEVPAELPDRVQQAVDRRVQAAAEAELLLGLVTLGKDTAELLLANDDDPQTTGDGEHGERDGPS